MSVARFIAQCVFLLTRLILPPANRLRQQKTLPREKRGRVRFADELGYDVILGIEGNGDRKQERQSRLLESLDLQSSVQNSTQFFKMAEKLAETDEHLSTLENRLREIPNGSDSGVSNTNRVRQHDRPISPGTQAALDAIENQEVELGNRDFSSAEDIPPSSSSSESNVKRGASNDSSNPASNGYHNGDVHRNLKGTRLSPLKCELRQAKGQQRKTITRIPPVRIDYNFKVIKQAVVPNSNLTSTDDTESADNTSIAVRSEPPRLRSIKHRKRPWREYVNLPKRQMQPSSKLSLEIMRVEASLARIDNNLMEKKQNIMEIDARSEVSRNISEPCSANSIEDVHAQSLYSNPDSKIPRPRIWGLERRIEATQTRGHLNPITYDRLRQHNEIMEQRNTTPVVRDDRNHDNIFDSVSDLDIPEMSFQRNKEQRQPWSLHSSRQSIQSMASIVKNIQIAPQVQPQQLPPVNEMTSIPLRRPNVLSTQEMAKPSNHRTMPIGRPVQALVPRNQDGGRIHIPDRHMYQILFGP